LKRLLVLACLLKGTRFVEQKGTAFPRAGFAQRLAVKPDRVLELPKSSAQRGFHVEEVRLGEQARRVLALFPEPPRAGKGRHSLGEVVAEHSLRVADEPGAPGFEAGLEGAAALHVPGDEEGELS
jgi:hypothetical protein